MGLYISLFPQLIAGPIIRFHDIASQLLERRVTLEEFSYGCKRFIQGLAKKVLIANILAASADQIFAIPSAELPGSVAWLGAFCYALQIYFDFSGYSDMAIGLGRMFGFTFLENFNYPYISQSIREFWRRWHISLSNWFKDYLYIPLGGNRRGAPRTYANLITVFFLCGLWHGASWNFILWGLLHGTFIVFEMLFWERLLQRCWRPLRHAYSLLVVLIGWVLFRAETMETALAFFAAMVGRSPQAGTPYSFALYGSRELLTALTAGIILSTPIVPWCQAKLPLATKEPDAVGPSSPSFLSMALGSADLLILALLFLASTCYLAAGSYNPFIYFRF